VAGKYFLMSAVEPLKGLKALEYLNLDNTRLSDDGTPYLSAMKNLTFLHLGSTQITDEGLPALEGLTKLNDLKLPAQP
jgi:Leucine-rich repeat (LRR) protein